MSKGQLVVRRLASVAPMLFLVSLLVFSITYVIPGDPAAVIAGENATVAEVEAKRVQLGLDRAPAAQYVDWLGGVATGDLGTSLTDGRSVTDLLWSRLPRTLFLAGGALALALVVGVPLGLLAATRRGSLLDRFCLFLGTAGIAMPSFWLAIVLVAVFSVNMRWLPATGYVEPSESVVEWFRHLVLPVVALSTTAIAEILRQTRAAVITTLESDYIRTAHMKGLPKYRILGLHTLKNASLPIITTAGVLLTVLLSGSVIIERVFGIPGLGDLAVTEVGSRNIPVIQGVALLTTVLAVIVTLVIDVLTVVLSPRVELK